MSDTTERSAPVLGYWENAPIVVATVQITNTGAGLDKGLAMEPIKLPGGSMVDVVLRCRVVEHRHDPLDEDWHSVQLVNRLKAEHATIVDVGEVASEALDRAEQRVAERRSELERKKREEAGEEPLFGDDGEPRGGDPVAVGDVLDDAIGLADGAEADQAWRDDRRAQLEGWTKETLTTELVDVYGADVPEQATKFELVEDVLDAEANS